jgi:NTE family protein
MVADPDGYDLSSSEKYGFIRPPALQTAFDTAVTSLLAAEGRVIDGQRTLVADLALEGGGVKGIGIVGAVSVLAQAGYRFERVAGSSAGAIAAALIAGISRAKKDMSLLKTYLDDLAFENFMPEGQVHRLMDHLGRLGKGTADVAILLEHPGLYSGDYLEQWLGPILRDDLGVETFEALKITQADDPDSDLPLSRRYGLVVHTSDVTRQELVRLPWDYNRYGVEADQCEVVSAVRASMSIPLFFAPVTFSANDATVDIPNAGTGSIAVHYAAGQVTWVDGGMLRNFPIDAFDRTDGRPPRWPTIGVKLSSLTTDYPATTACRSALEVMESCVHTMMSEWDTAIAEPSTAARTIFVDNAGITTTQFNLSDTDKRTLFLNGVRAATEFVIASAGAGGVMAATAKAATAKLA